jgi:transposase, IS6 family
MRQSSGTRQGVCVEGGRPCRWLNANNPIEADHGRLKARLRPMRGLKRLHSADVIAGGHAFVQNLRRGHYELAIELPVPLRLAEAFTALILAV